MELVAGRLTFTPKQGGGAWFYEFTGVGVLELVLAGVLSLRAKRWCPRGARTPGPQFRNCSRGHHHFSYFARLHLQIAAGCGGKRNRGATSDWPSSDAASIFQSSRGLLRIQ